VLKRDKERVVAELTERLRTAETLIVADYRGLSVSDLEELRTRLIEQGARFTVVKNTLTRLAAEAAGTEALLEYIEGPTAIAFIQPDGDPVAVAKVLSETARRTRVLAMKGGLLEGRPMQGPEIEELAKLPAADVLRGQVLGAVIAPLNAIVGLLAAPLQDLYGLIDARIEQIGGQGETPPQESADTAEEPVAEVETEPVAEQEAEAAGDAESEESESEAAEPAAAEGGEE
jgi:large subunit ribosomal protein L10